MDQRHPRTVAVVAGGTEPQHAPWSVVGEADLVVAADSGYDHARLAGVDVDVLVGDLDSISAVGLQHARHRGVTIVEHPAAKDESDLELALVHGAATGASRLVVVASAGGRPDHALAIWLLLSSSRWADVEIVAWLDDTRVTVVRDQVELSGPAGSVVSLFSMGEEPALVTTEALEFSLDRELLPVGVTRGLSNTMLAERATVIVEAGVVVAVQPPVQAV